MEITEEFRNSLFVTISQSVQEANQSGEGVELSFATILFGENAVVDSLTLVNIIVDLEDAIFAELGRQVTLTDDEAVFRDPSPYTSVGSLLSYISEVVESQ